MTRPRIEKNEEKEKQKWKRRAREVGNWAACCIICYRHDFGRSIWEPTSAGSVCRISCVLYVLRVAFLCYMRGFD